MLHGVLFLCAFGLVEFYDDLAKMHSSADGYSPMNDINHLSLLSENMCSRVLFA